MSDIAFCVLCGAPVTCGQRDRGDRSVHYGCQLTGLPPELRHPGLPNHEAEAAP
jgi:hypothetical protein